PRIALRPSNNKTSMKKPNSSKERPNIRRISPTKNEPKEKSVLVFTLEILSKVKVILFVPVGIIPRAKFFHSPKNRRFVTVSSSFRNQNTNEELSFFCSKIDSFFIKLGISVLLAIF